MYSNWKHIFSVNTIWIIYYSVCHMQVLYIIPLGLISSKTNAHAVRITIPLVKPMIFSSANYNSNNTLQ